MPKPESSIDVTFAALADPTRSQVIAELSKGPAAVSDLAKPFAMALPSFTQHLGVLEKAGLITSHRDGRKRVCTLNIEALCAAEDWLSSQRRTWNARLDRLEAHLDSRKDDPE